MSKRRRKWEAAFLAALEKTGSFTQAAKAAKVGRQTVYDYKRLDPEFDERCRRALDGAADVLEAEARRRAIEGDQVPVFYRGKLVGHKPRKSDTLLMFLLKNHYQRPEPAPQHSRPLPPGPVLVPGPEKNPGEEVIMVTGRDGVDIPLDEWCAMQAESGAGKTGPSTSGHAMNGG